MRRDKTTDSFAWYPADGGRNRRVLALLAVGVSCALSGFFAGRLSLNIPATPDNTSKVLTAAPSSTKSTQTNIPEVPPKKNEQLADNSPADPPPVVVLNPGTASGKQAGPAPDPTDSRSSSAPEMPRQKLRNELSLQADHPPGKGNGEGSRKDSGEGSRAAHRPKHPGTPMTDYEALRDYMMRR